MKRDENLQSKDLHGDENLNKLKNDLPEGEACCCHKHDDDDDYDCCGNGVKTHKHEDDDYDCCGNGVKHHHEDADDDDCCCGGEHHHEVKQIFKYGIYNFLFGTDFLCSA